VSRRPEFDFQFVARYEVFPLDRIRRDAEFRRVLSFPNAIRVDAQQELADGVILAIRPAAGEPWIGIFESYDYGAPPAVAPRQVLGWPDERSLCFVGGGGACVVRTDEPDETFEIDCWPISDVLVVPDRELVVFGDFISLIAYGRDGVAWRTRRLAWDDVKIIKAEGETLTVSGYDPTASIDGSHPTFTVDLRTGASTDKPYPDDWDG
jgi:hypothetical protein